MSQSDPKEFRPPRPAVSRRRILALGAGVAVVGGAGVVTSRQEIGSQVQPSVEVPPVTSTTSQRPPSHPRAPIRRPAGYSTPQVYDWAEARYRRGQRTRSATRDADTGALAWGESRALQSYLTMYQATNDLDYLDRLVGHSQRVLGVRDDRIGRVDYLGRSQPAWSAAAPYTVSTLDLRDVSGEPVVRIVVAISSKSVKVDIRPRSDGLFDLTVSTSSGLTEKKLALSTRARHPRYFVRYLDDHFPGTTAITATDLRSDTSRPAELAVLRAAKMATTRYVFAVHTAMICTAWARFATLVARRPDLRRRYASPAAELCGAVESAVALHDGDWRRLSERSGIYAFAVGAPVLNDGTYLPHNQYLAMARCLADLAGATHNSEYRRRAAMMFNLFRSDLSGGSAPTWPYHWSGSRVYRGFDRKESPSQHWPRMAAVRSLEDTSHGALDVAAVVAGFDAGFAVPASMLQRLANTFRTRVMSRTASGRWKTARRIGSPQHRDRADLAGVGWLVLAPWDRRVYTTVSALLTQIKPVPSEGQMLSAIAQMVSLS